MTKILFVDDDADTLETLTRAVQLFGHEAYLAQTGKEALHLAVEKSPQIIFIDMSLPDMDGITLLASLQHDPRTATIPSLMLSAGPEADAGMMARQAGARAYVNKPVRLQTLLDLIQKYAVV